MKKIWLASLVTLISALCFADIGSKINLRSQDGTVNTYPYAAKFTNGTITDNGDGTVSISIVGGSSGASSLAIYKDGVQISSPTSALNFIGNDISSFLVGTSSVTFFLNPNTTDFIHNQAGLQAGTTFYISSATVQGQFSVTQPSLTGNGFVLTSSGTGKPMVINSNGNPSGGAQNQVGALTINGPNYPLDSGNSSALLVLADSTTNNTNGAGLLEIWEQNPNHNAYLLSIHGTSTRNSDEPIRFDGPTWGIDEVNTSTDNAHGIGKWKVISSAYQSNKLQVASSRAWDNTTFEHLLEVYPLAQTNNLPGLYISPQDLTNDSGVLTSSDTAGVTFAGLNGSSVGLTGPLNPTASYTFGLPSTVGSQGQLLYHNGNRGNNFNVRQMEWTSGGATNNVLTFNSSAAPSWSSSITVSSVTVSGAGAGIVDLTEGSAPAGATGHDIVYADSTGHALTMTNNNSSTFTIVGSSVTPTVGHIASWSGTGTLIDGGTGGGGGGTPGGSSTQVQYNNSGSFAGSSNFTFNGSTISVVGDIVASSQIITGQGYGATRPSMIINADDTQDAIRFNQTASAGSFTRLGFYGGTPTLARLGGWEFSRAAGGGHIVGLNFQDGANNNLFNIDWTSNQKTNILGTGGLGVTYGVNAATITAVSNTISSNTFIASFSTSSVMGPNKTVSNGLFVRGDGRISMGTLPYETNYFPHLLTVYGSGIGDAIFQGGQITVGGTYGGQIFFDPQGAGTYSLIYDTLNNHTSITKNGFISLYIDNVDNVGVGNTSAPLARFDIVGNTSTKYALRSSSATVGGSVVAISTDSHIDVKAVAQPTLSSCGTSPTLTAGSGDSAFTITAGASATGCTVTFASPYTTVEPTCTVTPRTGSTTNAFSYTVSQSQIVITQTGLGGNKVDVHCIGHE